LSDVIILFTRVNGKERCSFLSVLATGAEGVFTVVCELAPWASTVVDVVVVAVVFTESLSTVVEEVTMAVSLVEISIALTTQILGFELFSSRFFLFWLMTTPRQGNLNQKNRRLILGSSLV
jgi:hypothetical protein